MNATGISAAQDNIGHSAGYWRRIAKLALDSLAAVQFQLDDTREMLDQAYQVIDAQAEIIEVMNLRIIEMEAESNPSQLEQAR
jgi:hypothetical protein